MEKVWLKNYPALVSEAIDIDTVGTIVSIMENSFKRFPDKKAFNCQNVSMTFAELDFYSRNLSAFLQNKLGMKKGDHIALMAPNILPFPVALVGALRAGLVVVNVNPLYTARELEHQLVDSEAKAILIFEPAIPTLNEIVEKTDISHVMVINPADMMVDHDSDLLDVKVPTTSFMECLKIGMDYQYNPVEITQNDLAFLQYTGGTTGLSKGAMLTHGNVAVNINQVKSWFSTSLTEGEEVIITALPLYHIFGLTFNFMFMALIGGCNLLISNPKDLPAMVAYLKDKKITAFTAVNTLFNGLLHTDGFDQIDFSNLKFCVAGGAALQQAVSEKWLKMTGNNILEGYGLSETSPVLTVNPLGQGFYKGSIGLPIPSTELCIMDDDGNQLGFGEEGELCARGPQVMQGYWKRPDATAAAMSKDGYFRTGDVAHVDEDGYFYIVDRKKDMILVSGFNVYPNEIEDVITRLDDVVECACVGVADDKSGEAVKVFAVKTEGSVLSEQDVQNFCRGDLAAYKIPKYVEFIEALPKSTVGKILRRELR